MFWKIIRHLMRIKNRDRIPKLPWGMLATAYEQIDPDSARVMARLGIRDPLGMKRAMKRHRVATVDELVSVLEHQRARRDVGKRWHDMLDRVIGGSPQPPHRADIIRSTRPQSELDRDVSYRLKHVRREMRR